MPVSEPEKNADKMMSMTIAPSKKLKGRSFKKRVLNYKDKLIVQ